VLIVAPTGSGKTVIVSEIIKQLPGKILFLTHRQEILFQARSYFGECNIIKAGHDENIGSRITVAQVQTLVRRDLPDVEVIISDEAHHAPSDGWSSILEKHHGKQIGLTATPIRLDGKGLKKCFDSIIEVAGVQELIEKGFLVKPEYWGARILPNLKGIKKTGGDFNTGELSTVCRARNIISGVVDSINKYKDRHIVVYAVGVGHAEDICREIPEALYLDGKTETEDRNQILLRFKNGFSNVLINVQVLTEGWDAPIADCIILARPTCSTGLYMQMVGRGLRPYEGKTNCLIIDHGGNVQKHGFAEDKREYTLDDGLITRKKKAAETLHTCQKCLAIFDGNICPLCGIERKKEKIEIVEHRKELEKIERLSMNMDDKKKEYLKYLNWARFTKRPPGAAYGRFKSMFGIAPESSWGKDQIVWINGRPAWKQI
jgi:superfamily II DNA or RNA helicase